MPGLPVTSSAPRVMTGDGSEPRRYAAVLLVPLVVALVLTLFAWLQARSEPRELPIGVAGPPQATAAIGRQLAQREDAFDVHRYGDEAAARTAIEDRDVYGAIAGSPTGVTVLTAPAASVAVAQLLQRAAAGAGAALLMVLVGNPWSGLSTAPELLPRPLGDIGQLMPPGAGGNALRSTAFFDGADAGGHLLVLVVWAALGLAALVVGTLRKPAGVPA
jgi:hypothetical protein